MPGGDKKETEEEKKQRIKEELKGKKSDRCIEIGVDCPPKMDGGIKAQHTANERERIPAVKFKITDEEGNTKETIINAVENDKWHDPVDNPQRTYYNSSSMPKEQNGAFGPVRRYADGRKKNHQGLDIFAELNTPCKACLNGIVVSYSNEGNNGYGNVLVLEVDGEDLRNSKRDYTLEFTDEREKGEDFDLNAKKFYLRYAHLSSAVKTSGNVTAGELIAYMGD